VKDNFAADREAAERVLAVTPGLRFRVRANRAFLGRATRFLAADAGIRQFLDIGTGIPAADNTHEVAQRAAPAFRVVYVDNDPAGGGHAARGPAPDLRRRGPVGDRGPADERDAAPGRTWSSRDWCRSTSGGLTLMTSPPRGRYPGRCDEFSRPDWS
jgi:S-adenosyl methyltransferase